MIEIVGSIAISIIQSILFYNREIGISMLLFLTIGNGIIFYILYKKNKIENKKALLWLIPILLLSSTYLIYANRTFYIANIIIISILEAIMLLALTGKKEGVFDLFTDTISGYKEGIKFTKEKVKEKINIQAKNNKKIDKDKIKKVCKSVLIVFAITVLIIILLSSADSIFANIFSDITDMILSKINLNFILNIENSFDVILRLIIILIIYGLSLSLIMQIQKKKQEDGKEEIEEDTKDKQELTIKLLLVVLNIVYLIFCTIQIGSLFARIDLNSETFNYSEYARSGFFQLMFVSFINLAIILKSSKYNKKMVKVLNIFLVIFTIIIVISSMYRMHMYEMEYGLTYLRIFVYIILITELIIFIGIVKYILNTKFNLMKYSFITIVSVYCIINLVNLEKIIVSKNINMNTGEEGIDYSYILHIATEDSYNILEKELNKGNIDLYEESKITNILLNILYGNKEMSWQEFNISKWNTLKNENKIQELKDKEEELERLVKIEEVTSGNSNIVYYDIIDGEEYEVRELDSVGGDAVWEINRTIDNGTRTLKMNTITVTTPSKIKFFENGLGFIEKPTSIYCGKADLLVTHDFGKTFEKVEFPEGTFSLSDPNGKKWEECYDYFYLPTKEEDGTLTVLVSGGYEGGYNGGKTRAKYISNDNGYTWKFVSEIWK